MEAHQAPLSLGFSRQEHWSGLPFPSPMHESEKWKGSCSVVSDPQRPHGLQPSRLLHPWDFPGKSIGVGCHCVGCYFLLQCRKVKSEIEVAQSCLTRSDPMNCSLPGSSVHGIFQARVLEWVATAFSGSICIHRAKPCWSKWMVVGRVDWGWWGWKGWFRSFLYAWFSVKHLIWIVWLITWQLYKIAIIIFPFQR